MVRQCSTPLLMALLASQALAAKSLADSHAVRQDCLFECLLSMSKGSFGGAKSDAKIHPFLVGGLRIAGDRGGWLPITVDLSVYQELKNGLLCMPDSGSRGAGWT